MKLSTCIITLSLLILSLSFKTFATQAELLQLSQDELYELTFDEELPPSSLLEVASIEDETLFEKIVSILERPEEDYSDITASLEFAVTKSNHVIALVLSLSGLDQNDSRYMKKVLVNEAGSVLYSTDWEYAD